MFVSAAHSGKELPSWVTSFNEQHYARMRQILNSPMLILPAASRGHALGFVRYGPLWAKIDRGENSLKEGSVNIYQITYPEEINQRFFQDRVGANALDAGDQSLKCLLARKLAETALGRTSKP